MSLDPLITVVSVLGLAAFTVSGVIEAKRKEMDLVGAAAVAFITAVGGGTVRDILLGRYPIFWIADQRYALGIFALAVVSFYSLRTARLASSAILVPDALGLGLFTVTGASYALASHASLAIASLLGVITGVFGGVLRDVVCNEIPTVFARTQLYATCALAGAWVYLLLGAAGVVADVTIPAGVLATFALRIAAVRFDLRLPGPR
ncbi:MAG TPA: trimeric intracellular cation channel family protein [Candidatus Eremiobacteraceae bacterium]